MILNVSKILLIAAVVCLAIFTLFSFGVITGEHSSGWLGLGLTTFAASFLA